MESMETAMDYEDVLLTEERVSREEYEEKQAEEK